MTSQDEFSDAQQLADWDREHVWHAFTQMQDYEPLGDLEHIHFFRETGPAIVEVALKMAFQYFFPGKTLGHKHLYSTWVNLPW